MEPVHPDLNLRLDNLEFTGPTQLFGGAHKRKVCVRAFIGVSVRSYVCN
jgi:hypothetical protein